MAERTLPGIGLTGFWDLGFDGWKDGMDANLRILSALVQAKALDLVSAEPGSPTDGDIYLLDETHATQANDIAIRDNGAWVYVTPLEGAIVYDVAAGLHRSFDGTVWAEFSAGGGGATNYIWGFSIEGTATASEVITRHAVGRDFTIAGDFAGGTLETMKGVNPTATAVVTLQRSTDSGATWSDVASISVSTSGVVTATTAGGAAISFTKGQGIRAVAPSSADTTFADWAFTVIGVS